MFAAVNSTSFDIGDRCSSLRVSRHRLTPSEVKQTTWCCDCGSDEIR